MPAGVEVLGALISSSGAAAGAAGADDRAVGDDDVTAYAGAAAVQLVYV